MPGSSDAERMAALTCRLGECPTQVFRALSIREAAQKHSFLQEEVLPLSTCSIPGQAGWEVLAAALQWNPSLRPSAAALAQKPWKEDIVADYRSPAQSSPQRGAKGAVVFTGGSSAASGVSAFPLYTHRGNVMAVLRRTTSDETRSFWQVPVFWTLRHP